jgi:hypothetical protein
MTVLRSKLLPALDVGPRVRRATKPRAELAAMWGAPLTRSLGVLVDHLGERSPDAEPSVGEFMVFAPDDWLAGDRNAFDFMLSEWFRRAALLAGALAIGPTGCGDIWLIDALPSGKRNRVFLLDHEESEMHAVADGLKSLSLLLTADGGDHAALDGRVRGFNDVEVPAGIELLADAGAVRDRFAAAKDVYGALWFGRRKPAPPAREVPTAHPAELVAHAVRAFLHEDARALGAALEAAAAHPARLARDAASSLAAKAKAIGFEARLAALGTVEGQ